MNATTNKLYVTNYSGKSVMVIDGNTMTSKSIAVAAFPEGIAVNEKTNQIYVSHSTSNLITVIDGNTERTATIATAPHPSAIVVNRKTNKIYVSHGNYFGVSVIDGATRATTHISSPLAAESLAVDESTNRVFVTDWESKKTAVLDGADHTFSTVDLGCVAKSAVVNDITQQVFFACPSTKAIAVLRGRANVVTIVGTESDARPGVLAINRKTNMVYASDEGNQYLTAISGTTLKVTNTPAAQTNYQSIAVNETTNKVYASDHYRYRVTVFDSQGKLLGDVQGFNNPADLAVNEATNKIYVLDSGAAEIRIIDGKSVAPVFTSGSPPNTGTVGVRYEHIFTAGGSLVPQFRVASGALPPGLKLEPQYSGVRLSGVPTTPGTYSFRVAASNGYNPDAVSPLLSITVKAAKVGHDFNGDRKPDVLSRDGNGNLWLYPGQGNGGWLPRIQVGQGWNVMTSIVAPGDFNGDGNADVLARDGSGALWLYPGNGRGGWFARVQVGQGWN
ncbi:FG-GAP-like repeat-containing protein [Paenarthrobacter sp. NPDC056912]|uniref:FG-GAP-like repeat-containing protein n=1 Tax=Paenarthrobacter sp. NPDC056912 TaxID=3345965 RepID=UPI00366C45F6